MIHDVGRQILLSITVNVTCLTVFLCPWCMLQSHECFMAGLVLTRAVNCSQYKDLTINEQGIIWKASRQLHTACGSHDVTHQCETKCLKVCEKRHSLREKVYYVLQLVFNRVQFS